MCPRQAGLECALCVESHRDRCLGTCSSLHPRPSLPNTQHLRLAAGKSQIGSSSTQPSCSWDPLSPFLPS